MVVQPKSRDASHLPIERLPDESVSAEEANTVLRGLARARAASDYQICLWLECGFRLEVHRRYAYASFREYSERVFQLSGRQTEDRLRVARALPSLPVLARAFREGRVGYATVRELTRVVTGKTEAEWLERAQGRTTREVERMVSGRKPGDRPDAPAVPDVDPLRWALLIAPDNHALLERVRAHLVASTGRALTDDELAVMIAERVIGGTIEAAADAGRAPFQIALHVCDCCGSATTEPGSDGRSVSETVMAMASCDAQHVGRVDAAQPARATQTVPPRVRRMVLLRHGRRCAVPGCRNCGYLHIHHVEPRSDGGSHDPENLLALCSAHHAAVHDGRLVVRGRASAGFVFEHADRSSYGSPGASGAASAVLEEVFAALTAMGFKHKQAQSMVDAIRGAAREVDRDRALRMALAAAPVTGVCEEAADYLVLAAA